MTGARGASLDVPHGLAGSPAAFGLCVTKPGPGCALGMKYSLGQEPWWNAHRRARFAKRAPHRKVRRYGSASVGVPLPFLSFVQSMTRKSGYRFSDKVMLHLKRGLKL